MKLVVLPSQKARAQRSAFSMVELMIGVLVIMVVFTSVHLGFSQGFAIIAATRENLRATQILEERTEVLRLYTWQQITNQTDGYLVATFTENFYPAGSPGNQGITFTGTVAIAQAGLTESYNQDMRRVTYTLTWQSGITTRTRSLTTMVSRYGLHNYYFN